MVALGRGGVHYERGTAVKVDVLSQQRRDREPRHSCTATRNPFLAKHLPVSNDSPEMGAVLGCLQGYLAHKKSPPPLGPYSTPLLGPYGGPEGGGGCLL